MSVKIDFGCRWEEGVQTAADKMGAVEILRAEYEADYQGFLDIDLLLEDGRVFSLMYNYGSCDQCDAWVDTEFNEHYLTGYPKLADKMLADGTFFSSRATYDKWREKLPPREVRRID